jgi:hypothetical protein
MKISELITMMQDALAKHGNLTVEIRDVENGNSYFKVGAYEDHATDAEKAEGTEGTFTIEYYAD